MTIPAIRPIGDLFGVPVYVDELLPTDRIFVIAWKPETPSDWIWARAKKPKRRKKRARR